MKSTTFDLPADDGANIHVYRWMPDDESELKAIIHIAHGLAEHAGRYARFAEALTEAGYGVYAEDHRGHGKSARSEDDVGHAGDEDSFNNVVRDLKRLNDRIAKDHAEVPRVLFGHSMGSTLTQQFLFHYPGEVDAAILSGSTADPGLLGKVGVRIAKLERLRLGKRGKSKLLHGMSFDAFAKPFKPNRTKLDWLSRDNDEVDKYVADPRCGFIVSTQHWIDHIPAILKNFDPANLKKIDKDTAIFIFAGERDPAAKGSMGVLRMVEGYKKAGLRRVQYKVYPDARHEMLNETNRDEVVEDLLSWLAEVLEGQHKKAA